jgi:hypothetical protein
MRWKLFSLISGLLILGLAHSAARTEAIVEESSGTEFPSTLTISVEDQEIDLRAAGTGLRKKAWFKVYAACFYVERSVDLGENPYEQAIHGDFPKRFVMHFLRDVGAKKIRGAFRDGIRKTLPEGPESRDEVVDAFCDLFTEEAGKGGRIVLTYLPGRGLSAAQAGEILGEAKDPELIAAIWATWFGEDPISEDLKKSLVGF